MDDPTPKKEEQAIILDYLRLGHINPERPTMRNKPIAQAIGTEKFTLMELSPKNDIDLDIHDEVYIGSGKREKINRVMGLLQFEHLTATSRIELEYTIKDIIEAQEEEYVKFFNEVDALNSRLHKLELIPGIGKKHREMILEERKKEAFKSFEDIKSRVPLISDPAEMLTKRVKLELDTTKTKKGKKKYYLFTQVPKLHPSNKRRNNRYKKNNRNNYNKNKRYNKNNKNGNKTNQKNNTRNSYNKNNANKN